MHSSAFGNYTLSDYALNKLSEIKVNNNPENIELWKVIAQEIDENSNQENECENANKNQTEELIHNNLTLASQYYFSQNITKDILESKMSSVTDIKTLLQETLEQSNGNLNLNLLKNLSKSEVAEVLELLSNHLSITGLVNTIKAMCDFSDEQILEYFDLICTKLILCKLCKINKKERTVSDVIGKLTTKFPDEIRKMIYDPMLNYDLLDSTYILNIIDACGPEKYSVFLSDFTSHANEIKEWHFPLLQRLISPPIEESIKSQLIKMFLDKCTFFANNKSFGTLMVTFITKSSLFSETEINILKEISDVHKTPLKRAMNNAIKKI